MRTEVAIYLPAGCTPESRRGFWWKQKRTCPATPGWIRCRSTALAEARTEAPVWLIHQAPQRGAPVLPPAELNFTSTLPPACEMLPEFAALNIESRKSKSRGKWTAVLASTVRGWLFRIMVGGVRGCGHHPVSDHPRNPSPQFHLPKVCDETLADYTFLQSQEGRTECQPHLLFPNSSEALSNVFPVSNCSFVASPGWIPCIIWLAAGDIQMCATCASLV